MEQDALGPAKLAVTVLLVAILMGLVIKLVSSSAERITKGMGTLNSSLSVMDKQLFAQYDNMTGLDAGAVLSSLEIFENQELTIIIAPKALNKGKAPGVSRKGYNYGVLLDGVTQAKPNEAPEVDIEYSTTPTPDAGTKKIIKGSTSTKFLAIPQMENGLPKLNPSIEGTGQKNSKEYVAKSGVFRSFLITNESDAIIGIYFEQLR